MEWEGFEITELRIAVRGPVSIIIDCSFPGQHDRVILANKYILMELEISIFIKQYELQTNITSHHIQLTLGP